MSTLGERMNSSGGYIIKPSTFEYCSLIYLNQWLEHDQYYCGALEFGTKADKIEALKNAAVFYRVARNLPTAYDVGKGLARYEPVLELMEKLTAEQLNSNVVKEVRITSKAISKIYKKNDVLSLTTKFLWLKYKSPIIIYDSQARVAIGTTENDLENYYIMWRSQFENNKKKISDACSALSDVHKYAVHFIGKDVVENISQNKWFHERVFDIYLWNNGK